MFTPFTVFTPGLEQVLHAIRPGARPAGRATFPRDLPERAARRSSDQPAHTWLRKCVDAHFAGDVTRVAVEDNLALFIVVHWEERVVSYANLQALWTDAPLARFAAGTGTESHRYLRLDYDLAALGPIFKEPQPHMHVEADGEPRFPVPVSADDVVGWFLDFTYRNFFYDDWVVWAEILWDDWCRERTRENRWPRLIEAFNQSQIRVIEGDERLKQDLHDLKRCLLAERRLLFPMQTSASRAAMLAHEPSQHGPTASKTDS